MRKLTFLTQQPPGWLGEFLDRSGATHYKGIGNHPAFDGVTTIGRVVVDENKEPEPLDTYIAMGEDGGDIVFDACWPEIAKNPQVDRWLFYNECSIWTSRVQNGFVAFNQQLIKRAHAAGIQIIVGAINTGHPKMMDEPGGPEMLDIISRAFQGADGYAVHCYHPANLLADLRYHGCRYREMHNYCVSIDRPHPPFFVLECGIDQEGGPDHGHSGWQIVLDKNWPAYRDMLVGYEHELQRDEYVECATIYLAEVSYGWPSFEVKREQAMDLADRLAQLPPPPPTPPPPPPPGGDMNVKYTIFGNKVPESEFRSYFGQSFLPKKDVGDGSNDSFPEILKAQIEGMDARNSLGFRCYLRMLDGSIPANLDRYRFGLYLYGNEFKAEFKIVDGFARAEWTMGHEGWPYHPESGEVGAATCWLSRIDGELHSEQVKGCGYFSCALGEYTHADLWFVIEPSGEPPPPPTDTYTVTTKVEPDGAGTVEPQTITDIAHGEEVTFEANPGPEMVFVRWTDEDGNQNANNPVTFAVTKDILVTAHFRPEDDPPPPPPPPPGPTPEEIEAARAAIANADELMELAQAQLDIALQALGVER